MVKRILVIIGAAVVIGVVVTQLTGSTIITDTLFKGINVVVGIVRGLLPF
jgi:hypothetical protein